MNCANLTRPYLELLALNKSLGRYGHDCLSGVTADYGTTGTNLAIHVYVASNVSHMA